MKVGGLLVAVVTVALSVGVVHGSAASASASAAAPLVVARRRTPEPVTGARSLLLREWPEVLPLGHSRRSGPAAPLRLRPAGFVPVV